MNLAFTALTAEPWAMSERALREMAREVQNRAHLPLQQPAASAGGLPAPPMSKFFLAGTSRYLEGGSGKSVVVDGVAIIPVIGPIFPRDNYMTRYYGATSVTELQRDLTAALNADDVLAAIYAVDSPGGAVSGVNAFADQTFAARAVKPIAAHVLGTAASAAYWIASATSRVTAEKTSILGSIGVVAAVPKQKEPDFMGDMWFEVVSTNAPNKRPDPESDDGLAEIRGTLDEIEAMFIADVGRGRGVTPETVAADFGKGGTLVGAAAVRAGMADKVTGFDAAHAHMARVGKQFRKSQQAAR